MYCQLNETFLYSIKKLPLLLILKLIVWKPLDKIKLKNDLQVIDIIKDLFLVVNYLY